MARSTSSTLSGSGKTPILILGIVVLAILAGGIAWVLLRPTPITEQQNTSPQGNSITTPTILPDPVITQAEDDDRDGLTNDEERELGTNPTLSDSDEDGLSDKAEVRVYTSDPRDADSDDDGTRDGEEVKNGSNPKGEGTLLDLESAIQALTTPQTE